MEDNIHSKSPPVPVLPPINTCVPQLFSSRHSASSHARHTSPPPSSSRISSSSKTSPLLHESPIKRERDEEEKITSRSGETPLRGHHGFDKGATSPAGYSEMRDVSPPIMDDPYSSQKCKLSKCCVCERGVPDSFSHAKPISWYVPLLHVITQLVLYLPFPGMLYVGSPCGHSLKMALLNHASGSALEEIYAPLLKLTNGFVAANVCIAC